MYMPLVSEKTLKSATGMPRTLLLGIPVNRDAGRTLGTFCDITYENLLSSFVVSLSEMYCTLMVLLPVYLDLERILLKLYGARAVNVRPRSWLVPVLLVMLREESSYGYALVTRLEEEFEFEAMNPGTLYRTLRQMENEGLCKSEWETSTSEGGPARRMYSITGTGEAHLDSWAEGCRRYQQVADAFFQTYKGAIHSY